MQGPGGTNAHAQTHQARKAQPQVSTQQCPHLPSREWSREQRSPEGRVSERRPAGGPRTRCPTRKARHAGAPGAEGTAPPQEAPSPHKRARTQREAQPQTQASTHGVRATPPAERRGRACGYPGVPHATHTPPVRRPTPPGARTAPHTRNGGPQGARQRGRRCARAASEEPCSRVRSEAWSGLGKQSPELHQRTGLGESRADAGRRARDMGQHAHAMHCRSSCTQRERSKEEAQRMSRAPTTASTTSNAMAHQRHQAGLLLRPHQQGADPLQVELRQPWANL